MVPSVQLVLEFSVGASSVILSISNKKVPIL